MQNDMLKNTIAPWQEKGRWYHGVIDMATNSFMQNKTDSFILSNASIDVSATRYLYVTLPYRVIDLKYNYIKPTKTTSAYFNASNQYIGTSTRVAYPIYDSTFTNGECEFWIFIV